MFKIIIKYYIIKIYNCQVWQDINIERFIQGSIKGNGQRNKECLSEEDRFLKIVNLLQIFLQNICQYF